MVQDIHLWWKLIADIHKKYLLYWRDLVGEWSNKSQDFIMAPSITPLLKCCQPAIILSAADVQLSIYEKLHLLILSAHTLKSSCLINKS